MVHKILDDKREVLLKKIDEIIEEANIDNKIYEVTLKQEEWKTAYIFIIIFGAFFLYGYVQEFITQFIVLSIVIVICAITYYIFTRYEARLSAQGRILRDDWLGFKMYLETAEKYRLERQLSPALFEKYLPYAMVFGVEKKWAKTFENMALPPPTWYGGGTYVSGSSSGTGSTPASDAIMTRSSFVT